MTIIPLIHKCKRPPSYTCCYHGDGGRIVVVLCHEPVHDGVLVVPLLVGGVGGLFAEAIVEVLQELKALPGHRAVDVTAEERVDEHAGGREPGGGGRRRRGR